MLQHCCDSIAEETSRPLRWDWGLETHGCRRAGRYFLQGVQSYGPRIVYIILKILCYTVFCRPLINLFVIVLSGSVSMRACYVRRLDKSDCPISQPSQSRLCWIGCVSTKLLPFVTCTELNANLFEMKWIFFVVLIAFFVQLVKKCFRSASLSLPHSLTHSNTLCLFHWSKHSNTKM